MFYVYVLKNSFGQFYIGYTNDLKKRVYEHAKKHKFSIVYYEAYSSENLAKIREKKLKYYGSAWRALKRRIA